MGLHNYNLFIFFNLLSQFTNISLFFHIMIGGLACFNKFYLFFSRFTKALTLYFFFLTFAFFILFLFKFYLSFKLTAPQVSFYQDCATYSTYATPFSDVLILLAIIITVITWIYLSERYLHAHSYLVFYFFIFITLTTNMVHATNLLSIFIFFELLFLPSLFFVYRFGYAKKVDKTISFLLIWTLTGSFLALMGVAYIASVYNTLDLSLLNNFLFSKTEKFFLFFLFFIGFGIKIPLWPFHYWLTKVHVEAPTGFSIFLSGFLVKTAFFCLAHFLPLVQDSQTLLVATAVVMWGFMDASLRMWSSTDIKRLIAFATIQEMNLITLFFLLLANTNFLILNLFLFVHGVLSAFLFFLVDLIQKRSHTRSLCVLSGFSTFMPKLHYLVWGAILIFRGFPIFIKFFIEWELLSVLWLSFGLLGVFFFFITSIFGVLGFCRIWFIVLYGQPSTALTQRVDVLRRDWIVGCTLVLILFLCNFFIFLFSG